MSGIELAGLITACSALLNVVLGFWGMDKSKKLDVVSDGMLIVESAVEENKHHIEKIPGGKAVTETIKEYGDAAKMAVSEARKIADAIARKRYEESVIKREHKDHVKRMKHLSSQ